MAKGGRPPPLAGTPSAVTPSAVTPEDATKARYFSLLSSPMRSIEVPAPVDSSPAFE
jgi:hypothetical protein